MVRVTVIPLAIRAAHSETKWTKNNNFLKKGLSDGHIILREHILLRSETLLPFFSVKYVILECIHEKIHSNTTEAYVNIANSHITKNIPESISKSWWYLKSQWQRQNSRRENDLWASWSWKRKLQLESQITLFASRFARDPVGTTHSRSQISFHKI